MWHQKVAGTLRDRGSICLMTWPSKQGFFMDKRVREIDDGPNFPPPSCRYTTAMTLQKLLSRGQVYFPTLGLWAGSQLSLANRIQQKQWYASSSRGPAAPALSQNPVQLSQEQIWASLLEAERPHVAEPRHPSWGHPPLAYSQLTPKHVREPGPDLQSFLPNLQLARDNWVNPPKTSTTQRKLMN